MSKQILNEQRFSELYYKIREKKANSFETDEYIECLYKSEDISLRQYQNYKKGVDVEDVIKISLAIGAVILLAWLATKVAKE